MARRLTGARVTTIAAFLAGMVIATAGTATAAKLVTGEQIRNGTITAKDLSKGLRAKLNATGQPGPQGPAGAPGAKGETGAKGDAGVKGDTGAKGDAGAKGEPGLSGVEVRGVVLPVANGGQSGSNVVCPIGKVALGGGVTIAGGPAGTSYLQRSAPMVVGFDDEGNPNSFGPPVDGQPANGWEFQGVNQSGAARQLRGYVICATAAP